MQGPSMSFMSVWLWPDYEQAIYMLPLLSWETQFVAQQLPINNSQEYTDLKWAILQQQQRQCFSLLAFQDISNFSHLPSSSGMLARGCCWCDQPHSAGAFHLSATHRDDRVGPLPSCGTQDEDHLACIWVQLSSPLCFVCSPLLHLISSFSLPCFFPLCSKILVWSFAFMSRMYRILFFTSQFSQFSLWFISALTF